MAGNQIADEARAIIARRRLQKKDIADHLGLIPSSLSRRLHGKTEFTASEVAALADALGVTIASLYGEDAAA